MSYHNTSSSMRQSRVNAQGQIAPPGYHYMPDGSLMLDSEMTNTAQPPPPLPPTSRTRTSRAWKNKAPDVNTQREIARAIEVDSYVDSVKVIKSIDIDFTPLPAAGKTLPFKIIGDEGATFTLEVKNEDNKYYNFDSKVFQDAKINLEKAKIDKGGVYVGTIVFPTVTDDDQYDISIFAEPTTTKHVAYKEVRFGDGSVDINSSTGSDSLLINKVIYQNLNTTLTIGTFSPNSTIETGSQVNAVISLSKSLPNTNKTAFSISCAVTTASKCYRIVKQPTSGDLISYVEPTIGTPLAIEGEDLYPTITETAQVQHAGISSSATIVLQTPVPDIRVGDLWYSDGTMPAETQYVQSITTSLGNVTQFVTNTVASHAGAANLTFKSQVNKQWKVSNFAHLLDSGMEVLPNAQVVADTKIASYEKSILELEGTKYEKKIILKAVPFKSTKNIKPTVVKGKVTVQGGYIIFDKAQLLTLGGVGVKIGGYNEEIMEKIHGYELVFSDLAIALTPVITTVNGATTSSTSVVVDSRNGILDTVSTVSGIGINSARANPHVASGAGAVSGPGTIVLSEAQTLEDNTVLTFANAGQTATITGNVIINKVGDSNAVIEFDVERLLSIT